jgi:hypothetical protein
MFDPFQDIKGKHKQLQVARVKKIVLGPNLADNLPDPDYTCEKDMGAITYEILYAGKNNVYGKASAVKKAYPIHAFIRQYPIVSEIVILVSGPSADLNDSAQNQDIYYFPPFSVFNDPHQNAFPNMQEYESYIKSQMGGSTGTPQDMALFSLPVGVTFRERDNLKPLRPFEGDTIIQGRWGQSIRMGSTVSELRSINPWSAHAKNEGSKNGDPITIFTNSQKKQTTNAEINSPTIVEDINSGGSSIYMTSTQNIIIRDLSNFQIRSWILNIATDPELNTVIIPEQVPISNEFSSPQEQDANSFQGSTAGRALVNRGDVG